MKKLLVVLFLSLVLSTNNLRAQQLDKTTAVHAAVEDLKKANKTGKYNVVITYFVNGRRLSETITVNVVDSKNEEPDKTPPESSRTRRYNNIEEREETIPSRTKKKKNNKLEKADNIFVGYETDLSLAGFSGYENWFQWLISILFALLTAIPMIVLRIEYVKTKRIANYVVSVFFEKR